MKEKSFLSDYLDKAEFDKCQAILKKSKFDFRKKDVPEKIATRIAQVIRLIRLKNTDELFIYDVSGYYVGASKWLLQSLVKYILNTSGYNWNTNIEREILGAIYRDCTTTIEGFNTVNAVNFQNGILFLDNNRFMSEKRYTMYFDYVLPYSYEKNATCPKFEEFISETMCENNQLIAVIQELMGYCLSANTSAEKAFFLYGKGCNGKSVLSGIMTKLVGESLTCSISLDALTRPFGSAGLIGKRVNIASENEKLSNSEVLKSLISCDSMNIPVKYKKDWEGKLFAKHIFLMNSLPTTPDITHGFFRKIIVIPFNHTVKKDDINVHLSQELSEELPGIFNWAYIGYKRLKKNHYRFSSCEEIDDVMAEYIARENPTAMFFHSRYKATPKVRIKKSTIYDDYCIWAENNGYAYMNKPKFYNALSLAADEDSSIKLNYKRINGINYLSGYVKKNS